MSRRRKPNSGDPRKRTSDQQAEKTAAMYRCSHCNSKNHGVTRDQSGIRHMHISHDDTCPVLNGTLSDAPDALRAAVAAGGGVLLVLLNGEEA